MFALFRELNWSLLGTMIVVSGVIAWAGDILGMKLGKKRISFMSLRPKYTSRVISVITGMAIGVAALMVASITSESVRTALFSMRYVQSQITNLTAELQTNRTSLENMELDLLQSRGELQEKQRELQEVEARLGTGMKQLAEAREQLQEMTLARKREEEEQKVLTADNEKLRSESRKLSANIKALADEVAALDKEAEALRDSIQRLRDGRIAALTGEILAQGVISDGGITTRIIDEVVGSLAEESRGRLAHRFGISAENIAVPNIDGASVEAVKKKIIGSGGRYLLRLTAAGNAVEGERVQAALSCFESQLIFAGGDLLAERSFASGVPRDDLEDQVYRMLRDVNASAASKGVLREPITGNIGTMDSVEFIDAIDAVMASSTAVTLQVLAADDIYTEGPVGVKFVIQYDKFLRMEDD